MLVACWHIASNLLLAKFSVIFKASSSNQLRVSLPFWCLLLVVVRHSSMEQFLKVRSVVHLSQLELMRELVQIGIHKFQMDLPSLLSDDQLLTHAIEEVLLFDRELRGLGYPPFYPCILNVLTADHCFIRWIALEKKCMFCKFWPTWFTSL